MRAAASGSCHQTFCLKTNFGEIKSLRRTLNSFALRLTVSGHFVTARGKVTMATMMVDHEILEAAHWLAILGCALRSTFSVSKGKKEEKKS